MGGGRDQGGGWLGRLGVQGAPAVSGVIWKLEPVMVLAVGDMLPTTADEDVLDDWALPFPCAAAAVTSKEAIAGGTKAAVFASRRRKSRRVSSIALDMAPR